MYCSELHWPYTAAVSLKKKAKTDIIRAVIWQYIIKPFRKCFVLEHFKHCKHVCSICYEVPHIHNIAVLKAGQHLDLPSPEMFAHTQKPVFFFCLFFFCGFSMPDYWLLCIDMYLIYHTHTLARWCFSTSVFPKMWKAFLYSRMSHFMFGWQSLILFCDDAYCSVWCKSTFQLDAIFFFFFKTISPPKGLPVQPSFTRPIFRAVPGCVALTT